MEMNFGSKSSFLGGKNGFEQFTTTSNYDSYLKEKTINIKKTLRV